MWKYLLFFVFMAGTTIFSFVMMNARLGEEHTPALMILAGFAAGAGYTLREFYNHLGEKLKKEKQVTGQNPTSADRW